VPLSFQRQASRGFNESHDRARRIAADSRLPLRQGVPLRTRHTAAQMTLALDERQRKVRGAFKARGGLTGGHVAVVDDVMTTGAAFDEVAGALKRAGAARATSLVVARTPSQRRDGVSGSGASSRGDRGPQRRQSRPARGERRGVGVALARGPDRLREVRVVRMAGNDVPVQVRHLIAEAGEVDLVRRHRLALSGLDREHHLHDPLPLQRVEVAHLTHVRVRNDADKAGMVGIVDEHDAQQLVAVDHLAAVSGAQRAGRDGHTSTRSMPPVLAAAT
jgi:hypothetical protein